MARFTSVAMQGDCLLCSSPAMLYRVVDGVQYFECPQCDFMFADPELIASIDAGDSPREYDEEYWRSELQSARERSYGSSLARLGEALLYCSVPVQKFIDIGTGPGFLLDAVECYLPASSSRFFGVEKFPPEPELRSRHANYVCADLGDMGMSFECGVCVEVLEHLTPAMARSLAESLRKVAVPGSLFLFNTGLTSYVRDEDPGYLDPFRRGHITVWSVTAARQVFEPQGFSVLPLAGKSWAFVVEIPCEGARQEMPLHDRIWNAPQANIDLLTDSSMGTVMHILARESARAYR
ncbi:hypothetical protein ACEPA4_02705 [Stenotrophomonas sp. P2112]|uniref:hypothetical protein n=1 Tax=Stenotrophomonas sp. P2112 TaxID=3308998 RepID=UPI0035A98FC7